MCFSVFVCVCLFVSVFELTRADTYTEITCVYYVVYTTGVQVCNIMAAAGCGRQRPSLAAGRVGRPWAYVGRCAKACAYTPGVENGCALMDIVLCLPTQE